jgi:hypothetical protein
VTDDGGDDLRVKSSDTVTSCKISLSDASMCGDVLPFPEKRDCLLKNSALQRLIITFEASLVISGG